MPTGERLDVVENGSARGRETGNTFKQCIDGSELLTIEYKWEHPEKAGRQPREYDDGISFPEAEPLLPFPDKNQREETDTTGNNG